MAEKILIVDDDPFCVQNIADTLAGHFEVLVAYTIADMVKLLKKHVFTLAILDLNLGEEGSGFEVIATIQAKCSKVLILTSQKNEANLLASLRAQAVGFIYKKDGFGKLLQTVRGAIAGYNMTPTSLLADLTEEKLRLPQFGWRELELIDLIYSHPAASTSDYAKMLSLAEGSVKNMFTRLFAKMNVHKKMQLLEVLKERGHVMRDLTKVE